MALVKNAAADRQQLGTAVVEANS